MRAGLLQASSLEIKYRGPGSRTCWGEKIIKIKNKTASPHLIKEIDKTYGKRATYYLNK